MARGRVNLTLNVGGNDGRAYYICTDIHMRYRSMLLSNRVGTWCDWHSHSWAGVKYPYDCAGLSRHPYPVAIVLWLWYPSLAKLVV